MTKAEKEMLKAEYIKTGSTGADEQVKDICLIVYLENGYMYPLKKDEIEKDFCYGYFGGESAGANNCAEKVAKEEDFFIKENLRKLNSWIKNLENGSLFISRIEEGSMLVHVRGTDAGDLAYMKTQGYKEISKADRLLLIEGFKQAVKDKEKRLKTYLKRYGLTSVRSWTYWRDE